MRILQPEDWMPADGISFERNAEEVLRSGVNYLVVAGPGAGKTELLAQRACYLLQTGLCRNPRRILAISFKRDAATNLRDRVELRCGRELASRFDSLTFDAFAKSLLDRFRQGLPEDHRPAADYDIPSDNDGYRGMNRGVGDMLRTLVPPEGLANRDALRYIRVEKFVSERLCAELLCGDPHPSDAVEWAAISIWRSLLGADKCIITFDMVKRLATYLLEQNPLLLRALRLTYSHVFLDEFQDTTGIQFDLLCACFLGSDAVVTAVGDDKQRIMVWAGAMRESFQTYQTAFAAEKLPLFCNHRSDSELVRIQQFLIQAIDPLADRTVESEANRKGDGVCDILLFDTSDEEAKHLCDMIISLLNEGVSPRDICLLSRIQPDVYCSTLLDELQRNGIRCRVETDYQDLMRDELVLAVLAILRLAVGEKSPEHWYPALELSCLLSGSDPEDNSVMYMAEERLSSFVMLLGQEMEFEIHSLSDMKRFVSRISKYYGHSALRAHFHQYRNPSSFSRHMNHFCKLLWASYSARDSWTEALDDFEGIDTIPAMTVHKSKGLEYHTVLFLGLEDRAWIRFAEQEDEHKCTFFVAFSRAKKQVHFTFCRLRPEGQNAVPSVQSRDKIGSLYNMLVAAGVPERDMGSGDSQACVT